MYIDKRTYIKNKQLEYYKKKYGATKKIKYYKKIYNTHPIYKIISNLASRINKKLKKRNIVRNLTYGQLLGCRINYFKEYLEKNFSSGMEYENYGEWEIDHRIPLSLFNLSDEFELKLSCYYTNLQPMWKDENRKKGNKFDL